MTFYQAPLRLELKRSKHLNRLLIFMHTLALLASVLNSLPISLKCLLLIAIGYHFYVKQGESQRYGIEYNETGWKITKGNEFLTVEILPSTVISVVAIFLQFKTVNNSNNSLMIFCDALTEEDYRALIVKLKTTRLQT